jgi:hypothetical protein
MFELFAFQVKMIIFVIIEILNENEKSKIFTHNYQCRKENIEKCKNSNNCYCFFFRIRKKNEQN